MLLFTAIIKFILPYPYSDVLHREEETADAWLQSFHPTISWSRNLECQGICRALSCLSKYLAKHLGKGNRQNFAQSFTFLSTLNICLTQLSQSSQTGANTVCGFHSNLPMGLCSSCCGNQDSNIAEKYLVSLLQLKTVQCLEFTAVKLCVFLCLPLKVNQV